MNSLPFGLKGPTVLERQETENSPRFWMKFGREFRTRFDRDESKTDWPDTNFRLSRGGTSTGPPADASGHSGPPSTVYWGRGIDEFHLGQVAKTRFFSNGVQFSQDIWSLVGWTVFFQQSTQFIQVLHVFILLAFKLASSFAAFTRSM